MTDKQRLEAILENLGISPMRLAKSLGHERGDRIYHVLHNRNGISDKLVEDIVATYPQFSRNWILYGKGEMLTDYVPPDEKEVIELKEKLKYIESQLKSKIVEANAYKEVILAQKETIKQLKKQLKDNA